MFSLCLYYVTGILVLFNLANLDVERDATDLCLTLSIEGGSREAAHTQRYHAYSHALLYLIYTKAVGRLTSNAVTPEGHHAEESPCRKFPVTPEGHQKVW